MKSLYLFLFFVFGVIFCANSQENARFVSFTNYGSCYQGLKSKHGKIIWPADFEALFEIWDQDATSEVRGYYWIAEKNGSRGLIGPDGKVFIPFIYSKIAAYPNGFIAADEEAAYLISRTGEIELKMYGYSWITPVTNGYFLEKDDKIGYMGLRFNEVLPPIYDGIHYSEISSSREGYEQVLSDRFLTVTINKETLPPNLSWHEAALWRRTQPADRGIFDLQTNKWVIPFTSDYIDEGWVTNCPSSDVMFRLYKTESNTVRIVNSSGNEVYSYKTYPYTLFQLTPTDSCGTESIQMGYVEEDRKMKVLNLKSGKFSNEHREITCLNGYSVYFDEKKWGVMDPNFVELREFRYPKYEFEMYEGIENAPRFSTARERFSTLFHYIHQERIDSVLITRTVIKESKKNDREREYEQFGLINFRTGKKVKEKYDEIVRRETGNQTVFWAYKFNDREDGKYYSPKRVDIYTSDLILVNQIENVEGINFDYYHKSNFNAVIQRNYLYGVVDLFGKELIPVNYRTCTINMFRNSPTSTGDGLYYYCVLNVDSEDQSNNRYGIFSLDGTPIIPLDYRNISIQYGLIFAFREKGNYDVFTFDGKLFFEGVNTFINAREVEKDGSCIGRSYSDRMEHVYFVKGSKLYHYFEGELELYDSESFNFNENYCYFLEWVIIDQQANVITTEPEDIKRRRKRYSNDFVTDCSTYFNTYPIPKKEVLVPPTPKPSAKIEKAATHQWKLGPTKSQTEWFLYTPEGKLMYSTPFEYPLEVDRFRKKIFKQKGKFGRFNDDYSIDIRPEYDYILPNGSIAKKDSLWYVRQGYPSGWSGWSEGFDNVTSQPKNGFRFVFDDGKIGLIDAQLNFKIPLTDSATLVDTYDLVKILRLYGNYGQKTLHESKGLLFNAEPADAYRKINNANILEKAYLGSTANEILEFSPVDRFHPNIESKLGYLTVKVNETQIYRERVPTYYNQYFYSEMTYTRSAKYYGSYLEGRHYANKATFNYKIVKNKLVPIQLSDILKSDSKSTEKLNELILRKLTEIQAYGDNCSDMDSKIEGLKANFQIEGSKIVFYNGIRGGFEISLYFSELQSLFREPKKMLIQ